MLCEEIHSALINVPNKIKSTLYYKFKMFCVGIHVLKIDRRSVIEGVMGQQPVSNLG